MKRLAPAVSLVLGCLLAGAFAAAVLADSGPPPTTTGATTTQPTTAAPPGQGVLPPGVTIGGVPVGGMSPADAYVAVRAFFTRPLTLVFAGRRLTAGPELLGAVGFALRAVAAAQRAEPSAALPLGVAVRSGPLRTYLATLAAQVDQPAVDAKLFLRHFKPWLSQDRPGLALDVQKAQRLITAALESGSRTPVVLPGKAVPPKVTRAKFGPVIVIHRGRNRLQLYDGMRLARTFFVATGQTQYPTPLGRFSIVVKWRNPWWYPPPDPWAQGEKPTPPGPGNPLGTRWMGLSAPGVGVHGTPNDASIGYSLSHGCIRMHIPEAEWLFERVKVGTPVYIVAA